MQQNIRFGLSQLGTFFTGRYQIGLEYFIGKFIQLVCYEVYIVLNLNKEIYWSSEFIQSRHFFIDDKNSIGCPFFYSYS